MPRYYFHVTDGRVSVDTEGTELAGVAQVREQAVRTAGEILAVRSGPEGLSSGTPWTMTVADETGKTVYSLMFEAREYPWSIFAIHKIAHLL